MDIVQLIQKAEHIAPELAAETAKIEQSVQQLQREIRTTSYLLHPPLLDETGLSSALGWYVQGLEERSGLDISLAISDEVGRLPRDMELAIFRIVQECLTNIHRHSGSKTARISMTRSPASCCVLIEDRGSGISPDKISEIQSGGAGVGIRGMRERLRQFDGNLHMESDESGTRVMVTIPVARDILDPPDELGIKPTRAAV